MDQAKTNHNPKSELVHKSLAYQIHIPNRKQAEGELFTVPLTSPGD